MGACIDSDYIALVISEELVNKWSVVSVQIVNKWLVVSVQVVSITGSEQVVISECVDSEENQGYDNLYRQ